MEATEIMPRRSPVALFVVACVAYSHVAAAQASSREPLAETLFDDGKALMAQGKYAEACPKLAESERLDPALGALLALAFCHEKEGKTATAWSEFVTARGLAQRTKEIERERLAEGYVEELEGRLVRVTIRVSPEMQSVDGFELRQNGAPLTKATWGTTTPVDPGEQVLEATAPGKRPWTFRFVVRDGDAPRAIEVPLLEPNTPLSSASAPPLSPPLESAHAPQSHSVRTLGYAIGGLGIASVAVGAFFGVRAIEKNDDAKALCAPMNCTNANALDLNSQARTSATVATVAITAGLVATGVGVFLVLRSRSSDHAVALHLVPLAGSDGVGAGMRGAW
jgi:hypothetical protein